MKDDSKKISYDDLISIIVKKQKNSGNIIFIFTIIVAVIAFIFMFFVSKAEDSIITKLIVPFMFLFIGIISKLYHSNKIKIIDKKLSMYRDEINEYNVCVDTLYTNEIYLYTNYNLFKINTNKCKLIEVAFSEISNVYDKETYGEEIKGIVTIVEKTDGKKAYLGCVPKEIKKSILKFYKNKNDLLSDKKEKTISYSSFMHDKYGKIECSKDEVSDYIDIVKIEFTYNNEIVNFGFSKNKVDEVMNDDSLKRKLFDEYLEFKNNNFLNIKERFIRQEYETIMNWWKNCPIDNPDSPIYTGNKNKEEFISALIKYDNFKIDYIYFNDDYRITKANYGMELYDYRFMIFYDLDKDELDFDVSS